MLMKTYQTQLLMVFQITKLRETQSQFKQIQSGQTETHKMRKLQNLDRGQTTRQQYRTNRKILQEKAP